MSALLKENDPHYKIKSIITKKFNVQNENYDINKELMGYYNLDSLAIVELVMEIEKVFNIEIHDEDLNEMKTIYDLEKYVSSIIN